MCGGVGTFYVPDMPRGDVHNDGSNNVGFHDVLMTLRRGERHNNNLEYWL